MALYEVEIEITTPALVTVEASSRQAARALAERGPAAWIGRVDSEITHVEAGAAWTAQDSVGVDEMTAWREREEDDHGTTA